MTCLILKAKARVENGHKSMVMNLTSQVNFRENNIFK